MRFAIDWEGNWKGDPLRYCDFDQIHKLIEEFPGLAGPRLRHFYEERDSEIYRFDVMIGAGYSENPWPDGKKTRIIWVENRRKILLDFECTQGWDAWEDDFDKVLHICPYTSEWRNNIFLKKKYPGSYKVRRVLESEKKYQFVYFPISPRNFQTDITRTFQKKYDVIYSGHFKSMQMDKELILPMKNFNYALVSREASSMTGVDTTHVGVSYHNKMKLYALSKISIVHNAYWEVSTIAARRKRSLGHRERLLAAQGARDNFAFSEILSEDPTIGTRMVPQLKSRIFEAAAGRSLLLVRKDSFNIIEHFFNENEDFIYFEEGELEDKINEILKNYDSYTDIINSAYHKVRSKYTTLNFFEDFILPFATEKI